MLKINSFYNTFTFDGKILLKNSEKYTGNFNIPLQNGKKLYLYYNNGLLAKVQNAISVKTYQYDNDNRLVNVKRDGKDIFVKRIKHNLGLEYTRNEIINNTICRTFDALNRPIKYVVSPKLLFGFIKYFNDVSVDTRYFLNEAVYLGNGHIKLKHPQGDPILNNGVIDKTFVREAKKDGILVMSGDNHCYNGTYKTRNNQFGAEFKYLLDKNNKPIWTHIEGKDKEWSFDKKVLYDKFGNKKREIFTEGKWFIENTLDLRGNIILVRRLNLSGETIQRTERKYNIKNLIVRERVYDSGKKLVEQTNYTYYKNNKVKTEETMYFDNSGSYKNVCEYGKNEKLIKFSEFYDDYKSEEYYDSNNLMVKYVEKNAKGEIQVIKEFINDDSDCLKTIVKNSEGFIKYQVEHIKSLKNGIAKKINIFKNAEGKLIGKTFIICNSEKETTNCIYTNAGGKRITYDAFCKLVEEDFYFPMQK